MRISFAILLFLPLIDLALLVPLQHSLGLSVWLIVLGSALFGGVLLTLARRGLERSDRGVFQGHHLAQMIDSQRTVMAGMLLVWPGIFSDIAAIFLLLTAPQPIRGMLSDYPLKRSHRP
jgi:UPF0716 protein FxsA